MAIYAGRVTRAVDDKIATAAGRVPRPALGRLRRRRDPETARSGDSKIHGKVKRLVEKLVGIEISVRNTRFCVGLHADILLRFSELFYDILGCFDFISAYFDLISFERPVEVDILGQEY